MNFKTKYDYVCPRCGKENTDEKYVLIDVNEKPELKAKAFSGELFETTCKNCGYRSGLNYPFTYEDKKHNFVIETGSLPFLFDYYENELKKDTGVILAGADSIDELESKATVLEEGLDYRVAEIYAFLTRRNYQQIMDYDHNAQYKIVGSFYRHNNEGKLVLAILYKDKENNIRMMYDDFDYSTYNNLKENTKNDFDGMFTYCFNADSARKYFMMEMMKEKGVFKDWLIKFATVSLKDGRDMFAYFPEFSNEEYKEGDYVILIAGNRLLKARINKLYEKNYSYVPFETDNTPIIAYKAKAVELVTSEDSDSEIDNTALKEKFEKGQNDKEKMNWKLLSEANVILGLETTFTFNENIKIKNEEDLKKNIMDENGMLKKENGKMTNTLLSTVSKDGMRKYLNVYLSQKDLSDPHVSRLIYKFDNVADYILNTPEIFDGILFNPEKKETGMSMLRLLNYKFNRLVYDHPKCCTTLAMLNDKEIEFIGEKGYDLLCDHYMGNLNKKDIKISDEERKEILSEALKRFKFIYWCNYMPKGR